MIRDRFAPSPTGNVHVGSLRTALYNYLFAKKNNGSFLLRLEDTDRTRYEEGSVENLLNALEMTKVIPDEGLWCCEGKVTQLGENGPYIQSERLEIYQKYVQILLDKGHAYYCFCDKTRLEDIREQQKSKGETPRYDGLCRNLSKEEIETKLNEKLPYTIRLKFPGNKIISFDDIIRGKIEINTNDLDDQVLMKSDGFPTYHFAVVIDDYLMKITHVIRGEEWLPSTPKHIYLYECLGFEKPIYVHLPNILNEDHKKLSKRQGDVSVGDFLEKGYLPEALINFLALLGWSPEGDKEIFSMEELIDSFDLTRINKSGAVFDRSKLNWMNAQYIKELTTEKLKNGIAPFLIKAGYLDEKDVEEKGEWIDKIAELVRDRINCFSDAPTECHIIFNRDYAIEDEDCMSVMKEVTVPILYKALFEKISKKESINAEIAQSILKEIQKEHKAEKIKGKALYMPTRIMLTGKIHGPDIAQIMEILGKEELLLRLQRAKSIYI